MKTASILLCLACAGAWAQNASSLQLPTPDPAARSNRAEIIRRALAARTNAAAASALTNVPGGAPRSTVAPLAGGAPATGAAVTAAPGGVAAPQPGAAAVGAIPGPGGAVPTAGPQPGEIAIAPTAAAATNTPEAVVPAGMIDFRLQDLPVVLQFYAELVNRTVLRPANLPATQITLKSQTDLTVREAVQALDAVLALNQITMINVGDKFVKAVPQAQAFMEGAAFSRLKPDELPELGKFVTHVVQLKYARPSEMVQVLQPLAKIPNSILPIDSSMMLVLRDYSENVKRMLEMIKEVDVSIPSEFISEVIPIKYALSSDIANALNSLGSGGGGTTVGGSSTTGTTGTMGGRSSFGGRSGASGSMGSRGGMMGYPGSTMPGMNPMGTTTTQAGAQGAAGSFTDRLRNIINRASVSGNIEVIGETKIIADERTNSLLVFATREDMKIIKDIVSKLDVVLAQVLIEAVIIEVQLGPNTKNFGISYLQHPKTAGDVTGVGAIGAPFLRPGDFVPGGGTNGGSGAGLGGGFNYLATFGQDLDVTLTAIASETRAKVLQRPRIQTSHAVQAQLFVGESRPYPTSSYYGGGAYGSYASIQQLQIGVTLDVTPLINPDGLVVMDIHQTIENYAGFTEITGVGQVPNTTRKEAAAKVAVRDRDTIMLGGLIETDKNRNGSGVPFLMNIPVLGYLFRSTQSSETRKELIVLIRPTVLPTPEVAALTAQSEKDRMPGVRRAEAEFQAREERELLKAEEELRKFEDAQGRKRSGKSWLQE